MGGQGEGRWSESELGEHGRVSMDGWREVEEGEGAWVNGIVNVSECEWR